jgi:MOSC domain-containing protein YiiM
MTWQGILLHIFITGRASAPMEELREATLIAGSGIEGDRYANGVGHFSSSPHAYRQITLIEMETLEALERDHRIQLRPGESRRNLVTRDVPLNHLVGRRFRVGETILNGGRLNRPCKYLEELLGKPVFTPLLNRAGLNCEIVRGGMVRAHDRILPENHAVVAE